MEIQPTGLVISLEAEAPLELLQLSAGVDEGAPELILERLDHGLYAEVDGQRVPLVRRERSVGADLITGHGYILRATWEASVPLTGRHSVRVGNANLGDGPSWFRDEVRLWPGTTLHATNLHRVLRGEVVDYEGRWLRAESLRRVDLDIRFASGPFNRFYAWVDPRPWSLADAQATGWAWRDGRENAGTVALSFGITVLLGVLASAGPRRPWTFPLIAPVWLIFAGLGLPPGASGMVLAAAAMVHILHPGETRWTVPLIALTVGTLWAPPWALWGAATWGFGVVAGRFVPAPSARLAGGLATLAVLVALRG